MHAFPITVDVANMQRWLGFSEHQPGRGDPTRACLTLEGPNDSRDHQRHKEIMELNELSWGSASTQAPPSLSASTFELEADEGLVETKRTFNTPTVLGRPDGLSGGFYELMQHVGEIRIRLAHELLASPMEKNSSNLDQALESLREAMESLQSISRPQGWTRADDDGLHVLATNSKTDAVVHLGYEKNELTRDLQFLRGGDLKVFELMRQCHTRKKDTRVSWVEAEFPSWEDSIDRALQVMQAAAATSVATVPFKNFITDRDGTVNNYCDRYASSQQSLYNAVWIGNFARKCTENSLLLTAAPLGERRNTFGLVELCTMPLGIVTYSGSKGREYYDHNRKRVVEIEPLPMEVQEVVDTLFDRLVSLCKDARNTKFLGLGSGLQRKCGEVTIARNDPSKTVTDSESRRFMADVQRVMSEVDTDSNLLGMHDTGTDLEIFPRLRDGWPSFHKGTGVASLNARLDLGIADGPNLVCGDTPSDLPMIEATLNLITNRPATNLSVLFVITPEQHERTPRLAEQVRLLCSENGAHLAILPSPDILVSALAEYTRKMGRTLESSSMY